MPIPSDIRDLIRLDTSPDEHAAIRALWTVHSKAEDARDLDGLISTLTDDCVYEIPQQAARWEGHAGARRFYTELLGAFPDIVFDLQHIVIGPQGVWEEAKASGTHRNDWLQFPATGDRLSFTVQIFFPWDPDRRLFTGERVFFQGITS